MSFLRVLTALLMLSGCSDSHPPDADPYRTLVGQEAENFRLAEPGVTISFPEDHGAHPEYRLEWWYLTANLTTESGEPLGAQWTLFRQSMNDEKPQSGWQNNQLWMAHSALTRRDVHLVEERFARGGVGLAGVELAPFRAWLENWRMESAGVATLFPMHLNFTAESASLSLQLSGPEIPHLQGENGYSRKHATEPQGSHYYSMPFVRVEGEITHDGKTETVSGMAWLDREWSSSFLTASQTGWDWLALRLSENDALMLYRLRDPEEGDYLYISLMRADGTVTLIPPDSIRLQPESIARVAGRDIPVSWQLSVAPIGLDIRIEALNNDSWNNAVFPYWEGPVSFSGTHHGTGYMELTGY